MSKIEIASYEPLALKYRPRLLEDVVGQDSLVSQLRGMMTSRRIARTFLATGPTGSGKTTTARIIARYVNCLDPLENGDPCGKCKSCLKMNKDQHPDIHEINAADARGIDDVRGIIASCNYSPQTNFRVYILDEVHQITSQAQGALLKILEEPPPSTIFILCTTNPEKLLPTITGRCQKLNIKPVTIAGCTELLKRVAKAEGHPELTDNPAALQKIAELTGGHPRDSLHALEAVINYLKDPGNSGLPSSDELADFIQALVEEVVELPPRNAAGNFLCAVYTNRYATALRMIKEQVKNDYFIRVCIELHTQTLFRAAAPKLVDSGQYAGFLKLLDDVKLQMDKTIAAELMPLLVTAASEAKTYLVDVQPLVYAMTAKMLDIVQRAQTDQKLQFDLSCFKKG